MSEEHLIDKRPMPSVPDPDPDAVKQQLLNDIETTIQGLKARALEAERQVRSLRRTMEAEFMTRLSEALGLGGQECDGFAEVEDLVSQREAVIDILDSLYFAAPETYGTFIEQLREVVSA